MSRRGEREAKGGDAFICAGCTTGSGGRLFRSSYGHGWVYSPEGKLAPHSNAQTSRKIEVLIHLTFLVRKSFKHNGIRF